MTKRVKATVLILLDVLICAVSAFLSCLIYYNFSFPEAVSYLASGYNYYVMYWSSLLLLGLIFGVYTNVLSKSGLIDLLLLSCVHGISAVLWVILRITGVIDYSGSITVIFFVINYLVTVFSRMTPKIINLISGKINASGDAKRAIIVGCGDTGIALLYHISNNPDMKLIPVALIDNDPLLKGSVMSGLRVVGNDEDLPNVIKKYKSDTVIVAIPSVSPEVLKRIYERIRDTGVALKTYRGMQSYTEAGKIAPSVESIRIEDLLGREPVALDNTPAAVMLKDSTVVVTGGAGSIGSELCRQLLAGDVNKLIIFDCCENGLYEINEELKLRFPISKYELVLGSVRDCNRLASVFEKYKPDYVFHAAAHKHVPMTELNPVEAVKNNVFGTKNVIEQCIASKVKRFILISTDKAVNSSSLMGATKHLAELLVMEYNKLSVTEFAAVRFGNVLGSAGSVVPLFKRQIAAGGPVTVTDPEMKRYFMTIPEAVSLVLQAGALAKGGEIFVLDMGQPVRIVDLATDMIKLSGLTPGKDIDIEFTGIRPGEKLFEELSLSGENVDSTAHDKIFVCKHQHYVAQELITALDRLSAAAANESPAEVEKTLFSLMPSEYRETKK